MMTGFRPREKGQAVRPAGGDIDAQEGSALLLGEKSVIRDQALMRVSIG